MEHKVHEVKEAKKEMVCQEHCEKKCAKNMSCFKGGCVCMKKLAKQLKFIMLIIITISVVCIAVSMNRHHDNYERSGYGQQRGMMQIYR